MAKKVANAILNVNDLVSSKREFVFKQVINGLLIAVIMVIFGCFDFAHPSFHFEYLIKVAFWSSIVGKIIADVCGFNIGINLIIDDVIKKDTTLSRNKTIYEELNPCRENDFDYYVNHVFNPQLKKETYINKINRQIYLLNKTTRKKNRLVYTYGTEEEKAKSRYCIKRKILEGLKSDEYIDENFDSLNVKYKDISPEIFELEIDTKAKQREIKVKGSLAAGRIKKTVNVVLSVVAITSFTTALVFDPSAEEFIDQGKQFVNWLARAVTDFGIITWQIFHGMLSAKDIVSMELTSAFAGRNLVLINYYAWRERKGEKVPQAYLNLRKEKNPDDGEIIMEIPESQLKELLEKEKTSN